MQDAKAIYEDSVSRLPAAERLRLAALILDDLAASTHNGEARLSVVELINSFPGQRAFESSSEADEFLRQERDSWER